MAIPSVSNGPTLVIVTDIPESAPPIVREGLARRALVTTTGACPCGATLRLPNRAERSAARGGMLRADVRHADDCPAIARATVRWIGA